MRITAMAYAEGYALGDVCNAIREVVAEATTAAERSALAELRAVEARAHSAEEWHAAQQFLEISRQPRMPEGIRAEVAQTVGAGNPRVFHAMFDMAVNEGAAK